MATFTYDATDKRSVNSLIGRVYGYMFFGLALTAIIAFGVGILFNIWIFGTINPSTIDYSDVNGNLSLSGAITLLVMLGITGIGLFVMTFVVHIVALRNNKSVKVPALIYCILMGLMLSELVIFVPWPVLGITFLITAGIYGIMYLISYFTKGSLNFLGTLGLGLLFGGLFLGLIGWILGMFGLLGAYMYLYWIVSLITFAAIMFITIWDMWRIKQIAEQGAMSENLALYCAFNLYVDFIYLFLQILRFVSYFASRRN